MTDTTVEISRPVTISEVFGPTFQGEGPAMGRRAVFARLGRCDLNCSWCDTPYTWDWDRFDPTVELSNVAVPEALADLAALADDHPTGLVITGGEPLLQRRVVVSLASGWDGWVQIETNGRHAPPDGLPLDTMIVVSPKLSNSGVPYHRAIVPAAVEALVDWGAHFKFVAESGGCVTEVEEIVDRYLIPPDRVWLMPQGRDRDTVSTGLQALAAAALGNGWNLSHRIHVDLWGDQRGV